MKISESKLRETIRQIIKETYCQDGKYTHFAVNKKTNKIVNGWDYHGYDSQELTNNKNYYFFDDLIDYELNPVDYAIWSYKTCLKKGIDPNNNDNWANA